jgi:hypothetical protein
MSKSIVITDAAKLSATITRIATAGKKLDGAIHAAAVSCLYHIMKDGQTTLYAKLAEAMPKGSRLKALHFWASHHAPMTVSTDKDGKVKVTLKKDRTAEDFDLAGAEATPFWAFSVEKVPGPMTVDKIVAWLKKQTNPENERVEDDARALAAKLLAAATLAA